MPGKKIQIGAGGKQTRANQEAAGIPDSKPFVAPEAERLESGIDRILKCHIQGQLVADLRLEPQVLAALDYYSTDEGIAERENRPMARESSGISLGKEETFDKVLQHKRDDVKDRGMELADAADPLREAADKYARPGMHSKFLSPKSIQENGSTGGYEVVKNESGDPVKVRGMVLGHIPEADAQAKLRHYQERGNRMLREVTERYQQEGEKTAVVD